MKALETDAASGEVEGLAKVDWASLAAELDSQGWAVIPQLLTAEACADCGGWYGQDDRFRSQVIMGRHGFGQGEYKYFAYPLPQRVQALRAGLYRGLAPLADAWRRALGREGRFPAEHVDYLAQCHAAGQTRPTPLLLTYGEGDYNCLHQDLYGDEVFPLQAAILLSAPGSDFTGGEFVLVEQRPRMQSRPQVVPLGQGDAVVFAVRERPVTGARGVYRVQMRHGVSRLGCGARRTLGVIFHDAR